jgi:hypothetical protein
MKNLIKKILKEEFGDDLDWIRNISGELPEITDKNKYLALVDILGVDEVFGDITNLDDVSETDFTENTWSHYGIGTFTLNNGDIWAVGTPQEFDDALEEYWKAYFEDVGYESVQYISNYISMSETDRRMWASSEADYYVSDIGDMELLEIANLDDEYNELEEQLEGLRDSLDDVEDDDEYETIENEIKTIEVNMNNLIRSAKQVVEEITYDEWYECLSDPYECLVKEKGWYSNTDDLLSNSSFFVDDEELIRDYINDSNWGYISFYDGEYYEVDNYVAIRIE